MMQPMKRKTVAQRLREVSASGASLFPRRKKMADEKTSLFPGLTASDTTLLVIVTVIGTECS